MTPLILLPGLACDGALFRDQHAALAALGPLHISDVHTRAATLPEMAALLLAEHPGPLALAGSSMGGMLALALWRLAPARVRGLALLGSSARADTPQQLRLRRDGIAAFEQGHMDDLLSLNVPMAFHPAHAAACTGDYLAMMGRAGAAQLIAQNRAVMARPDQRPHLGEIRVPTLVVGGEDDLLTPPECSQEMAAAIPGAELLLLPRCGHLLTWEQPAAVTAALCTWRQRVA